MSDDILDPATDAALALAAERPWREVSLRQIAERAGVDFAELYAKGGKRERFAAAVKGLQDALGDLNDMEVAREKGLALAEAGAFTAGHSPAEGARQAFAAGLMIGARAKSEKPLVRKAARMFDALMDARPYWR